LVSGKTIDSVRADVELPVLNIKKKSVLKNSGEAFVIINSNSWQGTGKSLADIIQEHSGIQTRKYGGLGSFQTVSIRGVPGSKVTVYMDNVPLNSAGGGAVDLGKINLASIEKIVVYKGITPGRFGGNSLGGLIHLITRPDAKTRFHAGASFGSFNTSKLNGKMILPLGEKLKVSSNLNYVYSDNDFKYLDRNNTPYNKEDDAYRNLQNGQFTSLEGTHQLQYNEKSQQTRLQYYHAMPAGGIPGQEGHVTETAGFKNLVQNVSGYYHNNRFENSGIDFDLNISVRQESPRYFWTDQDNLTWSIGKGSTDIGSINYSYTGSMYTHYKHKSLIAAEVGFIGNYQTLEPVVYNGNSENNFWKNNRTTHAVVTEINTGVFSPASNLILGHRIERVENNSEGGIELNRQEYNPEQNLKYQNAYRGGVHWIFENSTMQIKLFSNLGKYYKVPSLTELYGGKWGILPNPDLVTETGWNSEVGIQNFISFFKGKHTGEWVLFRNSSKAAIYYVQSAQLLKPKNLNSSENIGTEINLTLYDYAWAGIENHTTLQRPLNTSELVYKDKFIPNQPAFSSVTHLHFRLGKSLTTTFTLDYSTIKYRDQANLQEIPPQLLHHIKIRYLFGLNLEFTFAAENITDEFYENAYSSYPYPGRQVHLSFNYNY